MNGSPPTHTEPRRPMSEASWPKAATVRTAASLSPPSHRGGARRAPVPRKFEYSFWAESYRAPRARRASGGCSRRAARGAASPVSGRRSRPSAARRAIEAGCSATQSRRRPATRRACARRAAVLGALAFQTRVRARGTPETRVRARGPPETRVRARASGEPDRRAATQHQVPCHGNAARCARRETLFCSKLGLAPMAILTLKTTVPFQGGICNRTHMRFCPSARGDKI